MSRRRHRPAIWALCSALLMALVAQGCADIMGFQDAKPFPPESLDSSATDTGDGGTLADASSGSDVPNETGEGGCSIPQCGGCVDISTDPKNCGACNHDCTTLPHVGSSTNVACAAGKCVIPSAACAQGFDHCTTNADDGCETDITRPDHCRACATTCPADKPICGAIGCNACPPGLRPCNGACVDPSVDPSCGGYLLSQDFCMIKAGGAVWCWPGGTYTADVSQIPGLTSVIQVSGAAGTGCALKSDGSIWCWSNAPPTDVSYGMKFRVGRPPTCAIDTSEKVYCLNGTVWNLASSSFSATQLAVSGQAGGGFYARAKDGAVWNWNPPDNPIPTLLALSGTYAQVEADQESTVLRTSGGAVLYNQMPVTGTLFAGATFTQVAAGLRGGCALASDGRVACWGYGPYGQLGDGTFQSNSDTMVQFGGANFRASEVARRGLQTCALKIDGTVWCAGNAVSPNGDVANPIQLNIVVP